MSNLAYEYSAKSSAIRAAKKFGLKNFRIIEVGDKFSFINEDLLPLPLDNEKVKLFKKSSIEKPTKKVWEIAFKMFEEAQAKGEKLSRKKVEEACRLVGIGAGTARTQYQHWYSSMKKDNLI